jgi:hypothetical protein
MIAAGLLAACAPTGRDEGRSDTDTDPAIDIASSICDGSLDLTMRFSFVYGGPLAAYQPVMSRHGSRFLGIDGTCQFYAYDSGEYPLGPWTPVITGSLSASDMNDMSEALQWEQWLKLDDGSLTGTTPMLHGSGYIFYVDGHEASCEVCNAVADDLAQPVFDVISDLYDGGYSDYEPEAVEVLVYDLLNVVEYPWVVSWGAALPLEVFLRSRDAPPSELGIVVDGSDAPWFVETLGGFQERDLTVFPRAQQEGIWVEDPPGYELFIGTVVPGMPEVWGSYTRRR